MTFTLLFTVTAIILIGAFIATLIWDVDENAWMSDETRERQDRLEYLRMGEEDWNEFFGHSPSVRELWSYMPPHYRYSEGDNK